MNGRKRPLVVVDPGHGGSDPGAVNGRLALRECDINLDLALLFAAMARNDFDVILARTKDELVSLQTRAEISNREKADVFLSFHCNAAVAELAHGFEVWTTPGETPADPLATKIFEALLRVRNTGRADWDDGDPDKEANFYVLRNTVAPAVLIEFGFISNDDEARWLDDATNEAALVDAVIEGLKAWWKAQ